MKVGIVFSCLMKGTITPITLFAEHTEMVQGILVVQSPVPLVPSMLTLYFGVGLILNQEKVIV